jgi:hypothetical protein
LCRLDGAVRAGANAALRVWLEREVRRRPHPGYPARTVAEMRAEERPRLRPVAEAPEEIGG